MKVIEMLLHTSYLVLRYLFCLYDFIPKGFVVSGEIADIILQPSSLFIKFIRKLVDFSRSFLK